MEDVVVKLSGASDCQPTFKDCTMGAPLTIEATDQPLRFLNENGKLVGTLTSRHVVAKRLAEGANVLHCSVSCVYDRCSSRPDGALHVRVVTGDASETFTPWLGRTHQSPRS